MAPVPTSNYVTFYDPSRGPHRAWLQAVLDRLVALDPGALDEGGSLRKLWKSEAKEPASPAPAGLDPRGQEEEGLTGPKIKAPVGPGDSYLLINDRSKDMKAFDHAGRLLWRIPCLARGVGGPNWRNRSADTPPGLYRAGTIYRDYEQNSNPSGPRGPLYDEAQQYGWYSIDMVELEGQEIANGRAGIMCHGGGSACGWPGAWAPYQELHPTLGCLRVHNRDLRDRIVPLCAKGAVYFGVFQDR